jgi:RecB family exonuclease
MEGLRPSPTKVSYLSPTAAIGLLECPLRVAFARDSRVGELTRRPKPEAILGSASHALLAEISSGKFDELKESKAADAVWARWDELVDQARAGLADQPSLGPIPSAERWPFYQVRRLAAATLATEIIAARRSRGTHTAPAIRVETELELVCEDPPLVGRIDRVEHTANGARIIDLKSGGSQSGPEMRRTHEIQLLLYAALYRAARGEKPIEIGIQYIDGRRVTRAVDWQQVELTVAQALSALERVNQLADGTTSDWRALAKPGPDTCLYCDFQPVCAPFFEGVSSSLPAYASSVVGNVVRRSEANDSVRIDIASELSDPSEAPDIGVLGVPIALAPEENDRVSVCWATRRGGGVDLHVSWVSAMYTWSR